MISYMISRLVIQIFGTLYPAYSSYKTVRTKDVRGYVQWMKYWIVFAFLSFVEPFCDFFFSAWMPFYYESKILMVAWLLCPATRGYNYLYRTFLHPTLIDNEEYIDGWLNSVKDRWHEAVLQLGKHGYTTMMQTMLKAILSRTVSASCLQISNSFKDQSYSIREFGEQGCLYHHGDQHTLIRTLFIAENRRNSDPNVVRQLRDSCSENSRNAYLNNSRGLTNLKSVSFDDDGRLHLSKSASVDSAENMQRSCRYPRENLSASLETLEELEGGIQNLPPIVNQRLAYLAQKLSLEGLTDEHIGTVVSTLMSNLDPTLQVSMETSVKTEGPLSDPSEANNKGKNKQPYHTESAANEDRRSGEQNPEKISNWSESRQPRAGRYKKLPAPSPPDSKNLLANQDE